MFIKNFIKTSAVTLAASMFVMSASDITQLVSFGDSLSDSGNVHTATVGMAFHTQVLTLMVLFGLNNLLRF